MRLPLLLLVAAFAFLSACGGDDDTPKDATPSAEATLAPVQTPIAGSASLLQSLGLQTQAVRWVDAEVFEKTISEVMEPFEANPFLWLPDAPRAWSFYASLDGAAPRPLYETRRWLRDPAWDKDGLSVRFQTRRTVTIAGSGEKAVLDWQGTLRIDPNTGQVREEFDALPMTTVPDIRGVGSQPSGRTVTADLDLAKSQALVTTGSGTGPFHRIDAVYLLDKQGKTKRLEGIPDLRSVNWLPSGLAIHAYGAAPAGAFVPSNDAYIIPASDGQAIHTGEAPFGAEGWNNYNEPAKGSRAALLVKDPADTTLGASLILIYDAKTRGIRVLGKGPPVLRPNPAGYPMQVPVLWPDASEELIFITGMDGVIVNTTTGASRPGELQELLKPPVLPNSKSPDGRYTAEVERDPLAPPTAECRGQPARLVVTDTQNGSKRTLTECPGGTLGNVTWVDNTRLIASAYNCTACEPSSMSLTLVDMTSGRTVSLTDGLGALGTVTPSPDRTRVMVSGSRLRLFDINGTLLRELGPLPDNQGYTSAAWAPDNRSFAYVVGPPSR